MTPLFQNVINVATIFRKGTACVLISKTMNNDSWVRKSYRGEFYHWDSYFEILIGDKIYFAHEEYLRPLDET